MKNASEIQPAASCFKVCTVCGRAWPDRQSFLSDPDITVGGYQVHFKELELGFFLFNHETCRNTLAAPVADFRDLYDGPVFEFRKTGGGECPGYCLRESELRPCPAACECAYVREILDRLTRWKKTRNGVPGHDR